jgi:hypothetical protein
MHVAARNTLYKYCSNRRRHGSVATDVACVALDVTRDAIGVAINIIAIDVSILVHVLAMHMARRRQPVPFIVLAMPVLQSTSPKPQWPSPGQHRNRRRENSVRTERIHAMDVASAAMKAAGTAIIYVKVTCTCIY